MQQLNSGSGPQESLGIEPPGIPIHNIAKSAGKDSGYVYARAHATALGLCEGQQRAGPRIAGHTLYELRPSTPRLRRGLWLDETRTGVAKPLPFLLRGCLYFAYHV
eukprot:116109-Chlamydomonas_euryale.AAC.1